MSRPLVVLWYLFAILSLNLYFPEACPHFRFITRGLNAQDLYPELFKWKIWMHSSLFNSVLNSTVSNRKATENSCASKQPSDAELAKRKNVRAKAKGGIKVYQFVIYMVKSEINAKFCHETLDGACWWAVNSNWWYSSVKLLDTSWLVHVAYAATELAALQLNGSLASTIAFLSTLSEFLWIPPPPQLHLYRSTTDYYICYLCSSSMS